MHAHTPTTPFTFSAVANCRPNQYALHPPPHLRWHGRHAHTMLQNQVGNDCCQLQLRVLNDQSSGSCRVLRSTDMSGHPDPASAGEYQISLSTHSRQTRQGLMLSFSDSRTVSCRAPRLSSPVRCQQHPQTPLLCCLLARTV
jgi:hypothetical protein